MIPAYTQRMHMAWTAVREPQMVAIPVDKAQLFARVSGDAFDGGRTAKWMSSLDSAHTRWVAVRDAHTGHTMHCVSDRLIPEFDLRLGLRLMAWMSDTPIVWYWWDQLWMRMLPAGQDPGREHVNGGWAIPGVPEIHVYRREEAHKVALHEMIHALGMDVPADAVEPVRQQLNAELGRELWVHLGEAYTELFAEWLWTVARASTLREQRRLWNAQVACATSQAAYVWARVRDSHTNEDTNIFAYYVLKWILMGHLPSVLLSPARSVVHWYTWWSQARPDLEYMANRATHTESLSLPMGMTCGV